MKHPSLAKAMLVDEVDTLPKTTEINPKIFAIFVKNYLTFICFFFLHLNSFRNLMTTHLARPRM